MWYGTWEVLATPLGMTQLLHPWCDAPPVSWGRWHIQADAVQGVLCEAVEE